MQVGMVSRMKFPISILPMVKIFSELPSYFAFTTLAAIVSISTGKDFYLLDSATLLYCSDDYLYIVLV